MSTRSGLDVRVIGERIAERRIALHLDQVQVAERARLSRAYVNRLERGVVPNPKIGDLEQVAEALQTSLVELLRQPAGTRTERYSMVCSELVQQLEDQPPAIADAVLQAWRVSMDIARARRREENN